MPNSRVVICIFGNKDRHKYTHYEMRTLPLLEEFKKHFTHCYFNPNKRIITKFRKHLFVLFHIKFRKVPIHFLKIKEKYKIVIWDVIDALSSTTSRTLFDNELFQEKYEISDIINCPNNNMKSLIEKHNVLEKKIYAIPHNWDPRIVKYLEKHHKKITEFEKPVIGYLGTPSSKKEEAKISEIKNINFMGAVFNKNNIGKFNCLCSLRSKKYSFGKPATKAYVAASLDSIIVAYYDEYGVRDLYGEDYPYYIKKDEINDIDNIRKTINYINNTYKTEIWEKALTISREVKEKTSIEYIGLQFKELILNYKKQ